MAKNNPKKHGLFGISNAIYNDPYSSASASGKRSAANVYDDTVWGREWGPERKRLAAEFNAKEQAGDDALARQKAQRESDAAFDEELIQKSSKHAFDWPAQQAGGQRYHVSPDGEARRCSAKVVACPYGEEDHVTIRDDQLKFLSTMGYSGEERQNIIGHWVKDKQATKNSDTFKMNLTPDVGVREVLQKDLLRELHGEKTPEKIIEVDSTIEMATYSSTVIRLQRKIGNTRETPWKDHAYWAFSIGKNEAEVVRTDRISEETLRQWVRTFMAANPKTQDVDVSEVRAELTYQLKQIINQAEARASLVAPDSVHYTVVPLEFTDKELPKKVNFSTSSFTAENLNAAGLRGDRSYLANGFQIGEDAVGVGASSWRAIKTSRGHWHLEVRGSRGDLRTCDTQDAVKAEAFLRDALETMVGEKDLRHEVVTLGAEGGHSDFAKAARVEGRSAFMRELMEADLANENGRYAHIPKNTQGALF